MPPRAPGPLRPARDGLTPEARVLFATVGERPEALRSALAGPLEWPALVLLSERERATPVLHRRLAALRESGDEALPGGRELLSALRPLAAVHEFRLLELERRTNRLLEACAEAGIEVVLLKGAALRRTVHASILERPMGDTDLLVAPESAARVRELARTAGWEPRGDAPPEEAYRDHHHLPRMRDRARLDLGLEIHTDLFPAGHPFTLEAGDVRRQARAAPGLPPALVPAPEHLLLHAALHFAWSHLLGFGAWRTLCDVEALVRAGRTRWPAFAELAHESRGAADAYWTLRLARSWAAVPVGEGVLEALRPPLPRGIEVALHRHFALRFSEDGPPPPVALERLLWEVAMRPRTRGHGAARPWTGVHRWNGAEGRAEDAPPPTLRRGLAAARHLRRTVTGR